MRQIFHGNAIYLLFLFFLSHLYLNILINLILIAMPKRWELDASTSNDETRISHNVTNFEFLYEPFYVSTDASPMHDERFLGYGFTRNTQVNRMKRKTKTEINIHYDDNVNCNTTCV